MKWVPDKFHLISTELGRDDQAHKLTNAGKPLNVTDKTKFLGITISTTGLMTDNHLARIGTLGGISKRIAYHAKRTALVQPRKLRTMLALFLRSKYAYALNLVNDTSRLQTKDGMIVGTHEGGTLHKRNTQPNENHKTEGYLQDPITRSGNKKHGRKNVHTVLTNRKK